MLRGLVVMLAEVIEQQLEQARNETDRVTPDDVEGWLEKATGGDRAFAEGIVTGMQPEVAAKSLLVEAGVKGINHGEVAADRRGKDFEFERTSRGYDGVDVKGGSQRPILPVSHDDRYNKLLLSINPSHLRGFAVKDEFRDGYVDELRLHLFN